MPPNEEAESPRSSRPDPKTGTTARDNDGAVDDSDDADGDFITRQQNLNQRKRASKDCTNARVQRVLPFVFLPNIRPLNPSDLDSVVALENAAFSNPEHRATPDKVLSYSLPLSPCSPAPRHPFRYF